MPAALELDGVVAGYGRVEVLHGVSLAVPEGSVVASRRARRPRREDRA